MSEGRNADIRSLRPRPSARFHLARGKATGGNKQTWPWKNVEVFTYIVKARLLTSVEGVAQPAFVLKALRG